MKTLLVALFAIPVLVAPARALDEPAWLMIGGGGARYAMSDLNQELTAFNSTYAISGQGFQPLDMGTNMSLAGGIERDSRWNFGVGYDRMFASTTANVPGESIRYQFTANAFRLFTEYSLRPVRHDGPRFGLACGIVSESGKITSYSPVFTTSDPVNLRGMAPMAEGYAGGDLWIGSSIGVTMAGGYRFAKLQSIHTEGGYPYDSQIDGSPVAIDFSGPFVRVGLKLVSNPFME